MIKRKRLADCALERVAARQHGESQWDERSVADRARAHETHVQHHHDKHLNHVSATEPGEVVSP